MKFRKGYKDSGIGVGLGIGLEKRIKGLVGERGEDEYLNED